MVKNRILQALAFAPGHITGFFEICDEAENFLEKGSRGAGVCITKGVKTLVRIKSATHNLVKIQINNQENKKAAVSREVANIFLANRNGMNLLIDHRIEIPIGCGLGTSGAGALSLALALTHLFNSDSGLSAGQVAHIAELKCRTGLGTVLAQYSGGFELRKRPGAPGIGKVERLNISEDYQVVCLILKKISTSKMLSDRLLKKQINKSGARALQSFQKQPTVDRFMKVSRDFAESVGLISPRIRKILKITDANGFLCSQAMFGETIFSIVQRSAAQELIEIFRSVAPKPYWLINAGIDQKGARLLELKRP
ncbi:MAG: hypothetical protein ABIK67_06180 [candidate division WOR-3 bacterium]